MCTFIVWHYDWTFDGEDVHCIIEYVSKEMHARFYVFKEMNNLKHKCVSASAHSN